jgi:signal transduction histidine kinase
MEKHGGTIDVTSEEGKGATFILHFPYDSTENLTA